MGFEKCAECDNPARTKGLCPRHYNQSRLGSKDRKAYGARPAQKCAIHHCQREAQGFTEGSLCEAHYHIQWRGGNPEERVLRKDSTRHDRKCWKPECPKRVSTRGLCAYHYRMARRGALEVPESLGVTVNPPCTFEGCTTPQDCKGLCKAHYDQIRKGGNLREVRDWGKYAKGEHICAIPSCRKPAISAGLCQNHKTLQVRYRLSPERMVEVWTDPRCENPGCGATENLHMDHDHATGEFRGLLCNGCNSALGFLREDRERILRLAEYIARFQ